MAHTTPDDATDEAALEAILDVFFAAFTTGPGCDERPDALRDLFVPTAVIVRTCGSEPVVHTVDEFVEPRRALLTGGSLVDFTEWREDGRIDRFGDIAAWFGRYGKSGVQDGVPFTGRGMKSAQFVRTSAGWRISAAAWDDERDGLTIRAAKRVSSTDSARTAPASGSRSGRRTRSGR